MQCQFPPCVNFIGLNSINFSIQSSELPIHLPGLTKGLAVQMYVAIVTSKGLQVQLHSKEFRHVGEWMATLSGEHTKTKNK